LLLGMAVFAMLAVAFHGGMSYRDRQTGQQMDDAYRQVDHRVRAQLMETIGTQRDQVDQLRRDAEVQLETMTMRLSALQAQALRLDALGSRLADMAGLEDIAFDTATPVGVGGPAPLATDTSAPIDTLAFLEELETLDRHLEDRESKLFAMEMLLRGRSIKAMTRPEGTPLQGGWISSDFGMRADPFSGRREFHAGIDIAGKYGSKVLAVAPGIVTWSGYRQGYGNLVEIDHGGGYRTRYAHNRKNVVRAGQRVEKGEVLAQMGSTGRSTGPHLHFEVLLDGKPVNPDRYLSLK